MLTRLFLAFALIPSVVAFADAPKDLASLFPKDTLVYGYSAGADASEVMAKDTSFGRLMAEPEVRRFTATVFRAIDELIRKESRGEGVPSEMIDGAIRVLDALWSRPAALGVIDFEVGPAGPRIDAALVCHVGKDAEKLADDINTLIRMMGAPAQPIEFAGKTLTIPDPNEEMVRPMFGAVGEYFVIVHGERSAEVIQRIETGGPSLTENDSLMACRRRIAGDEKTRSMAMFINMDRLSAKLKALALDMAGPERANVEKVCAVLQSLGLENLSGIAWESHYRKDGCYDALYFHTPGGGRGLLSPGARAITEDDLKLIPKNARWASAANVNLADALRALLTHAKSIDPQVAQQVDGVESVVTGVVGVPPVEFLELFGDTFVIYDTPNSGGIWFTGAVAIIESSDADKAEKHVLQTIRSIASMIAGEVALDVRSQEHGRYTIQFVNVAGQPMPFAPAWARRDGRIIMALYPQMVASTLDRLDEGDLRNTSILANEDFDKARGVLGDLGTSFTYTNTREGVQALYPLALMVGQMGAAMAQGEGVNIDISAMPSLRTLEKHIHGQTQFTQCDSDGTLISGYGSIPFGVNSMAPASLTLAPMATAFLVPAMSESRGAAKRTVCAANLRGIGQGLYIYAQDDGKFPTDFQTLIDSNILTPGVFYCPSTTFGPGDPLDSCYVLVPGQTTYSHPANVLAYERPGNQDGEGVNVLFQDGHVQLLSIEEFEQRLAETKARLEKKGL